VVVDDHAHIARLVANRIATLVRERRAGGQRAVLGLATGSTPIGVYRELIRMHREEGLSFANVVTFNLDEYYPMARDSVHSYHRYMWENLFAHVDVDPANVHLPPGELPRDQLDEACLRYELDIERAGGVDFQLLGIGKTGHIGFNEPGSGVESRTRVVHLDNVTRLDAAADFFGEENVPREAVTMGVATILAAREIVIIATGEHKAPIVRRAVEGEVDLEVAATFLQRHPNTTFYVDAAAAADLTRVATPWLLDEVRWTPELTVRAVTWLSLATGQGDPEAHAARLRRPPPVVARRAAREPRRGQRARVQRPGREDPRQEQAADRQARDLLLAAPRRRRDLDGRHPAQARRERQRRYRGVHTSATSPCSTMTCAGTVDFVERLDGARAAPGTRSAPWPSGCAARSPASARATSTSRRCRTSSA
jgi:glucosamine-6-phosphate isomerase